MTTALLWITKIALGILAIGVLELVAWVAFVEAYRWIKRGRVP